MQMSHSTTSTSTYVLTKYSRAYPAVGHQTAEWQHFTNPVIRLVLDTTKRNNNELDVVRLRILWNMSSTVEATAHADMVFEDLELLSFSSLLPKVPQKQPAQGLPLKAIYRDTTVGIRYMYPRDNLENPTYRRFQISFQTPESTLEFIRSIRAVCPCKATPQSMNGPATLGRVESLLPPQAPPHVSQASSVPPSLRAPHLVMPSTHHLDNRLTQANQPCSLNRVLDSSSSPSAITPSIVPGPSSKPMNSSPLRTEYTSIYETISPISTNPAAENHHRLESSDPFLNRLSSPGQQPSSLPEPSQNPRSLPYPSSEPQSANGKDTDALLNSLSQAADLYSIPPSMLERLVGEVIREDGFVALLENLDKLWKVKTLVGTQRSSDS